MRIDCYTDSNGFQKLQETWERALDQNPGASIFQTLEWNRAWWDSFGNGSELILLAVSGEVGYPVGIAPLYRTQDGEGENVLRLVGGTHLSDYLDLIYVPGQEEMVCLALLDYLREDYREWDSLELHNVPADSLTPTLFRKVANEMGFQVTVEEEDACPYIPLPSTWESYLASLSKRERHELRRKMRKAGKAGGDKRYVVGDNHNLSEEVEEFILLHCKSRDEKDQFMEDGRKNFFLDFTARFHQKGWLDLSFLMIKGQRAASLLSFKYRGKIYLYNSGFDPAFSSYSAGIALMGQSIKAAIEDGYQKYDFLRGGEGYKYRFGARDFPVYRINISAGK